MQHTETFDHGRGVNRRLMLLALALATVAAFFAVVPLLRSDSADAPSAEQQTQPSVSTAATEIQRLEQTVRDQPQDVDALSRLGSAYVQRARETADPSFYSLAETAIRRALAVQPDNTQTLIVDAALALSRHDFAAALAIAQRVEAMEPSVIATYAVETDALVELGRYDEAGQAAQKLADMRPDFAAYTRISYLRELHGDIDGALDAMQRAIAAGSGVKQDIAWARVLDGNLHLMQGDINDAETQYRHAEASLTDDPQTHFGMAKLAIARGDDATAEAHLRRAIDQRPLPEYVILLGDLLSAQGRETDAAQQYDLVRAEDALFAANGVDTDLELALFDADHGVSPEQTRQQAIAAYQRRPTVYGADTVAWAAYKAGRLDDALTYVELAGRLGTRDPRLAYHRGMIELASGNNAAARTSLRTALDGAAALSPYDVNAIRNVLASSR